LGHENLSRKYSELRENANKLEEYLDLKETALAEIRELRGLIDSNKKLYKNYIAVNVIQRIEIQDKALVDSSNKIYQLEELQDLNSGEILKLRKLLERATQTNFDASKHLQQVSCP